MNGSYSTRWRNIRHYGPPGDQMWVNLNQLIRNRVPDRKGNLLPVDLKSVTYELRDLTPGGRNLSTGGWSWTIPSDFPPPRPCNECCEGIEPTSPFFVPDSLVLDVGELEGLSVEGVNSCTGGDEDITNDFTLWGSDDPNVATLTSKQVKAIGAGFTYGYANGDIPVNDGCGCIFLQSQPTVPATVVTVAFTIQSSGTPPTDNSARDAYKSEVGTYNLGPIIATGQECSIGFQVTGSVTPSTYTGTINLVRTKGGASYTGSTGQTVNQTYPSGTGDTSKPQYEDTNPQSGGSNGVVYDLDAPGVIPVVSQVGRIRYNYIENAQWGSTGNSFRNDVSGDNTLGMGTTKTSWNLQ